VLKKKGARGLFGWEDGARGWKYASHDRVDDPRKIKGKKKGNGGWEMDKTRQGTTKKKLSIGSKIQRTLR